MSESYHSIDHISDSRKSLHVLIHNILAAKEDIVPVPEFQEFCLSLNDKLIPLDKRNRLIQIIIALQSRTPKVHSANAENLMQRIANAGYFLNSINESNQSQILDFLVTLLDTQNIVLAINTSSPLSKKIDFTISSWDKIVNMLESHKNQRTFMKQENDIQNRTGEKRLDASRKYIINHVPAHSIFIDIGSGLGHSNSKLAGITVKELQNDVNIQSKNITIIATDIPSEIQQRKDNNFRGIDNIQEVPEDFETPVRSIVDQYKNISTSSIVLRSANSIDKIMDVSQTYQHLKHIAVSLQEYEVTYMFNKYILHKQAHSIHRNIIGELDAQSFQGNGGTNQWKTQNQNYILYK